jgi:hypothetical protein
VHNFTTSFKCGRALCLLVNYYHPTILALSDVQHMIEADTGSAAPSDPAERARQQREAEAMKWVGVFSFPTLSEREFNANAERAKHNFALLNERVRRLGSIPLLCMWPSISFLFGCRLMGVLLPATDFCRCCRALSCAVLCCAVLCCAVLCCAVLCCAVLCCAVLYCGGGCRGLQ